jgi:hypothetical protein
VLKFHFGPGGKIKVANGQFRRLLLSAAVQHARTWIEAEWGQMSIQQFTAPLKLLDSRWHLAKSQLHPRGAGK